MLVAPLSLILTHTLIIHYKKLFFFNVKKVQFKGSICFKLVPGILDPGPSSKVTLSLQHNPSS